MTDHPIAFSSPMILALLDGRKTQTRRMVTPHNTLFNGSPWPKWAKDGQWDWSAAWVDDGPSPAGNPGPYLHLPYLGDDVMAGTVHRIYPLIQPGDRLWVREAWRSSACHDDKVPRLIKPGSPIGYEADQSPTIMVPGRYRHARFMPRWASRLTLTVTDVRAQLLQEISEANAWAEGCRVGEPTDSGGYFPADEADPSGVGDRGWDCVRDWYADLWDNIHGPDAWADNPLVWVYTFTVARGNIDNPIIYKGSMP